MKYFLLSDINNKSFFWNNKQAYEMLSLAKMFYDNNPKVCIVSLFYNPHLRLMLHDLGLNGIKSFSVFDIIQNIPVDKNWQCTSFSIDDLTFKTDVEWVYGLNSQVGFIDNTIRYVIEPTQYGFMSAVYHYDELGHINNKLNIDDRGFISSCEYYENDKINLIEYYDINNNWRVRQYPDYVEVNPKNGVLFNSLGYKNIDELIEDQTLSFLDQILSEDDVFANLSKNNVCLFNQSGYYHSHYWTLFGDVDQDKIYVDDDAIFSSNKILIDSQKKYKFLESNSKTKKHLNKVLQIRSIVDNNIEGASSRIKEQIILVPIEEINKSDFEQISKLLYDYCEANEDVRVIYFGQESKVNVYQEMLIKSYPDLLMGNAEKINEKWAVNDDEDDLLLDQIETNKIYKSVDFVCVNNRNEFLQLLHKSRILCDLSLNPNIVLQQYASSVGIPQINIAETGHVVSHKNGLIIKYISDLERALDYYLKQLKHWNECRTFCMSENDLHSAKKIFKKVEESGE